jgi:hypothetical protein
MQHSIIIQSNGTGKEELESRIRDGWTIVSITRNNSPSYNNYLVILEDNTG